MSESSVDDIEEILDSEDERKVDEEHLGAEYCHLVYYCRLCKKYLQGDLAKEKALQIHCRSKLHVQNFNQAKSTKPERRPLSHIQEKAKSNSRPDTFFALDKDLANLLKEQSELKNAINKENRN